MLDGVIVPLQASGEGLKLSLIVRLHTNDPMIEACAGALPYHCDEALGKIGGLPDCGVEFAEASKVGLLPSGQLFGTG